MKRERSERAPSETIAEAEMKGDDVDRSPEASGSASDPSGSASDPSGVASDPSGVASEPGVGGLGGDEDNGAPGEERAALDQLDGLHAEIESLNDRHLRLAAEFDNYRKRVTRERGELEIRGAAGLVGRLLDALDDLQRVASHSPENTSAEAVVEGVALVEKKLTTALEAAGLETIEPRGELFDPESMEALMTVAAEHPDEDDVVADVFQKGYRFQGRLVRPARVQVKKHQG